jgi:hypothetical protein
MKKKVIILRFGASTPLAKEVPLIHQIIGGEEGIAVGCSTPFGILSIVQTTMEPKEITDAFAELARKEGDSLPVIVIDTVSNTGYNFDREFFENFAECNAEFDKLTGATTTVCTLSLDELLDLVKEKGISKFTEAELKRLQELSK